MSTFSSCLKILIIIDSHRNYPVNSIVYCWAVAEYKLTQKNIRYWGANYFSDLRKFAAFYGTRQCITVLTRACHRSRSDLEQSSPPFPQIISKFLFNILHSMPRISEWSLAFRFSYQMFLCIYSNTYACCITLLSHSSLCDHTSNIRRWLWITHLPVVQFFLSTNYESSCHSVFPICLLLPFSSIQIFSSAPIQTK